MRRKDKAMSEVEVLEFLEKCDVGRLGTCSGNIPYITPVNYIYCDGCIYFHCALEGHKLDNIRENNSVCFEVDEMMSIINDDKPCNMSTKYSSVVIFGKVSVITDEDAKLEALRKIVDKYSDDKNVSSRLQKESLSSVHIIKIVPEVMTGKKSVK